MTTSNLQSPWPYKVPTLIVNEEQVRRNTRAMLARAQQCNVTLRPHFKTHQSLTMAAWMRDEGIDKATVSSLSMAQYFASEWKDITVAFPFNWHELSTVHTLLDTYSDLHLGLVVESMETIEFLSKNLIDNMQIRLWIKIDTGYHRTGVAWENMDSIVSLCRFIQQPALSNKWSLAGLLVHAGHSYQARSRDDLDRIHQATMHAMTQLQERLEPEFGRMIYSWGDTPCCSTQTWVAPCCTEMRPGNFCFYDVEQYTIGSCASVADIAVCLVVPVVAKHPERQQIVVYGGAVHLSKDSMKDPHLGVTHYGLPMTWKNQEWTPEDMWPDSYVVKLSQEHGVIQTTNEQLNKVQVGDWIGILPVHSCLTVDAMGEYRTLVDGKLADHFRSHRISLGYLRTDN
jgi:D-serine deaminase-like pyridoxal phosphate-dependent protein